MFWRKKIKIPLSVPGPSPWYLRTPWAVIKIREGEWIWESYEDSNLSGATRLITPNGDTVLLVDFYCYVMPLPFSRVLIWYESGRVKEERDRLPRIVFTLLNLHDLESIPDHVNAANKLRNGIYIFFIQEIV